MPHDDLHTHGIVNPQRYDSYVVCAKKQWYLNPSTATGAAWNHDWRYATPMTKAHAEWWAEILRARAVESAWQCDDIRVEPDYHHRKPETTGTHAQETEEAATVQREQLRGVSVPERADAQGAQSREASDPHHERR